MPAQMSRSTASVRRSPSFGPSLSGTAVLAVDGQLVPGLVLSPHAELGLFLFVLDEPEAFEGEVEEGSLVRIQWQGSTGFDAVAELLEVDDRERWVLSVPVQLDSLQKRQSPRIPADGAWTLETEEGDLLEVYDLSVRGIGIEFPAGEGPAGVGECIVGVLRAETIGDFEVRVECTNVRTHPDDDRLWIVGGRLVMADRDARRAYEATLMVLGE